MAITIVIIVVDSHLKLFDICYVPVTWCALHALFYGIITFFYGITTAEFHKEEDEYITQDHIATLMETKT